MSRCHVAISISTLPALLTFEISHIGIDKRHDWHELGVKVVKNDPFRAQCGSTRRVGYTKKLDFVF